MTIRRGVIALGGALALALLPASMGLAQSDDVLPFEPLPTSAECTTGEPRDVEVAFVDASDPAVTTRDPISARPRRSDLNARALGRMFSQRRGSTLPVGDVVHNRTRYAAAATKEGVALFRISGDRHPKIHVLQVVSGRDDHTGDAAWLPILDVDVAFLDRAALVSNATLWPSAGDLAVDGDTLYAAIPDEHRVLAISLDVGKDRFGRDQATVWNFVEADVNAPWAFAPPTSEDSFTFPTQLGVDDGYLYIAEDHDGSAALRSRGDDVWVAAPGETGEPSPVVGRFATLEHCDAKVTGLHVAPDGTVYLGIARKHFFFGLALKN
ncbi:MAG: hypothetical protein ACRDKT_06635 [Actinomycetota bacterium]